MDMYRNEIDLSEDRQTYMGTYVAPVKVSTKNQFEYIKKLFTKYEANVGLTNFKHTVCNVIGVQYSYLDFLKMNKEYATASEIKIVESSIKSYGSMYIARTGKKCGEK